ncbi:hypothetical protein QQ045_025681 [Rhodiola kirilowii]
MEGSSSDDFSVLVLASDLGIDHRPFLSPSDRQDDDDEGDEEWHDCAYQLSDQDFSDLDLLQFFRVDGGLDKSGNRIVRIVGKYFPAPVVSADRLKNYIFQKITTELQEGAFCIAYFHSTVQKDDNCPGITILRWLYEELPSDFKDRLQIVYFIHPGLRSRLLFATLGRFFLSGGLYWKVKYISRLQYLWEDIKKGDIEIPEFVQKHDDILEQRPLTDYGIEPDPHRLVELNSPSISFGRVDDRWSTREFLS